MEHAGIINKARYGYGVKREKNMHVRRNKVSFIFCYTKKACDE